MHCPQQHNDDDDDDDRSAKISRTRTEARSWGSMSTFLTSARLGPKRSCAPSTG